MSLAGKSVLITGAAKRLGKEMALSQIRESSKRILEPNSEIWCQGTHLAS